MTTSQIRLVSRIVIGIVTTSVCLIVLAAIGYIAYPWISEESAETYGLIYVDSPEVYTRERLVNDRFLQDAWLRDTLEKSNSLVFASRSNLTSSQRRDTSFRLRTDNTTESERGKNDAESTSLTSHKPMPDTESTQLQRPENNVINRASVEHFDLEEAFRTRVRAKIIENQLDDRHDLHGNSLYLFKFDATVIPGQNTRSAAQIRVHIAGRPRVPIPSPNLTKTSVPYYVSLFLENPRSLDDWQELYKKWIRTLENRLNATLSELMQAYRNNRFSFAYYREMFAEIASRSGARQSRAIERLVSCMHVYWNDWSVPQLDKHILIKDTLPILFSSVILNDGEAVGRILTRTHENIAPDAESGRSRYCLTQDLVSKEGSSPSFGGMRSIVAWGPTSSEVEFVDFLLDFAARKAVQTVIGRDVYATVQNLAQGPQLNRESLDRFVYLAFDADGSSANGGLFFANERQERVWVIEENDLGIYQENVLANVISDDGITDKWVKRERTRNFVANFENGGDNYRVYNDVVELREDGRDMGRPPFYPVHPDFLIEAISKGLAFPVGKELAIPVETGLFNFMEAITNIDMYSYAVTPKKDFSIISIDRTVDDTREFDGAGESRGIVGALGGRYSGRVQYRSKGENVSVVGFGESTSEPGTATFGWVISPTDFDVEGGAVKRMLPTQRSLSALVSVPAWWSKVLVRVEKTWLDKSARPVLEETIEYGPTGEHDNRTQSVRQNIEEYEISLPVDFEAIDLILLGSPKRNPEVFPIGIERPIRLVACRSGNLLIPGSRLWRSAKVTLGTQLASRISVLPDMKGIIAHFDRIEVPPNLEINTNISRVPITIWTSEGSHTLTDYAEIRFPAEDNADRKQCPNELSH